MPLYEYRCKACGHRFEKIQTFSAPDEKECPQCKGEVERLISAPAVRFSGSGFYSTDYPSKSSAAPKPAEGAKTDSAGSESGNAATPSTDTSKPAASAAAPPAGAASTAKATD